MVVSDDVAARAKPSRLRAWIVATRPPTLSAAVVPVLVGTAVSHTSHAFRPVPVVLALIAAVLIQEGTNFANDLSDFAKGADTATRLGPVRGLQSGLITTAELRRATIAVFGAALLIGVYLVATHGWPILLIGSASILSGLAYTGGPWPLGYHGLGDVFVFVFFGVLAVLGSAFLQTDSFSALALAASVPVGLLCTAILVVNNLRDADTDRLAGKHTLAVILGKRAVQIEYAGTVVVAYLVPLAIWRTGGPGLWWLPWLSLPLAVALLRDVLTRPEAPLLNRALKRTGQLHLLFGLLFAVSFVL